MLYMLWNIFIVFFLKLLFYYLLKMHIEFKSEKLVIIALTGMGIVDCLYHWFQFHFLYLELVYLVSGLLLTLLLCKGKLWERVLYGSMETIITTVASGLMMLAIREYPMVQMQINEQILSDNIQFCIANLYVLICTLCYLSVAYINVSHGYMPVNLQMGMIVMLIMSIVAVDQILVAVLELRIEKSGMLLNNTGAEIVIIMFLMVVIFDSVARTTCQNTKLEVENKQYQMEMAHIDSIEKSVEALHIWKHDYQQHIRVVIQLVKERNYDVLDIYCGELEQSQNECEPLVVTGNTAIDALLSDKLMTAKSYDIQTEYTIALPGKLPIEQMDLCIILGNILDNAIEACEKITDKNKRYIRINLTPKRDMFLIDIGNSSNGQYQWSKNTMLSTKLGMGHGIGMKRVEQLVNQYSGLYEWEAKETAFLATIAFPLQKGEI